MGDINWGSVPDWVAAIGTIGSLYAALWLLKQEINDRRRHEAEAQTQSARAVSAWVQTGQDKYLFAAKNSGEEPVYDCVVYSDLPIVDPVTKQRGVRMKDEKTPMGEPWPYYLDRFLGVIPPGETSKFEIDSDSVEYEYQGLPDLWIEFTDVSGKHWKRDAGGKIHQITERTPWD